MGEDKYSLHYSQKSRYDFKRNVSEGEIGMVSVLREKKILICCLLGGAYLAFIGGFAWYYIDTDNLLEILYYVSQIFCGGFVVVGAVIAVIQYVFNSNEAKAENNKQRTIEAARLADEFRKTALPLINELCIAFSETKLLSEIIEYLDKQQLEQFNKEELDKLFPQEKWMEYRIEIAKNYLLRKDTEFKALDEQYNATKDSFQKRTLAQKLNEALYEGHKKVSEMSNELANTLEYMCICFNTNIADDETVYQSLHKVFFLAVQIIYIFTFSVNQNEHDRLFYNIMILYKRWKKISIEKQQQEKDNAIIIEEQIQMLKKQYDESIHVKTIC